MTATATPVRDPLRPSPTSRPDSRPDSHSRPGWMRWWPLSLALIAVVAFQVARADSHLFPESWNLGLRDPIDEFQTWVARNRSSHVVFTAVFTPISDAIDWALTQVLDLLTWLPWFSLPLIVFVIVARHGKWGAGLIAAACAIYPGLVGLWEPSLETLALTLVSVFVAVLIGVPLGVGAALNRPFDTVLRPTLDAMQTVPAPVYLIPAVLFFGIGAVPAAIATVVFALPPIVRLTTLGIRQVPTAITEAGTMTGSTRRQLLTKVQIPLAVPSIATGINQTINMALGIVVIAALVGAGGLGQEVIQTLRLRAPGRGMVAGLAIVAIAIMLDRVSRSFVERPAPEDRRRWPRSLLLAVVGLVVGAIVVGRLGGWIEFPGDFDATFADPLDDFIVWIRDSFGDQTQWVNDFVIREFILRGKELMLDTAVWPSLVVITAAIGWWLRGWRLALTGAACLFAIGFVGLWAQAAETFVQVLIAVIVAVIISVPIGVGIGRSRRAEVLLSPVLDALQTVPSLVYAIPFVMIFSVGPIPGIIASVLYALPVGIRLTALGIRHTDGPAVEAAETFGATRRQALLGVRIPMALPAIVLAVNQVIMMVLAMVIIAGLVGGGALGYEAVAALTKPDTGLGVEVGIAIVAMATILDRYTQAVADRFRPPTS